jgi:hypothetical protein
MKNVKLMTLGIVLVSASLALAQPTEVIRERMPMPPSPPTPPETDSLIGREVSATAERISDAAKAQAGAQKRIMLAQAGGGMGGGGFGAEVVGGTHQRSSRALVIPKDASDPKSLGEVEEDLGVMAHILDKAVSSGDKAAHAMGIAVFGKFPGMATAPQNLYIEGHGAIFLLNVNYPLLPPPAKADKEESKEPENNEWEEARRELARPTKSSAGADPFIAFEERFSADAVWSGRFPPAEYDADKVEDLKKYVVAALKNAANIRRLKSDELVTVVVTGAEAGAAAKTFKAASAKPGSARNERVVVARVSSGERGRVSDGGKMIFRARKADAEAFQSGKLDLDAFRKKVTMLVY